MPLDPATENLLTLVNAPGGTPMHELGADEARAQFEGLITLMGYTGDATVTVAEQSIAGVPCQVLTPPGEGPFPVLVYIHGGGWVIGSAAMYESLCRDLAATLGCVVVNVDYRLAPEHTFPAAADDCAAVTNWVLANAGSIDGRADRVAVAGDSAGGNLSAVTANHIPGLVAQVLIYPATDLAQAHPSVHENAEGYLLTKADMEWFMDHYVPDADQRSDPRVSPLHAPADVLGAAPQTLVITAEYDPLRDEGEAYAVRLEEAGASVTHTRYDGTIHGFVQLHAVLPAGGQALKQITAFLGEAFS